MMAPDAYWSAVSRAEGERESEGGHDVRGLMESASCASGAYSSGCSSSDPRGCPCESLTDDERTQILDLHNERREQSASGNELCATSDFSDTTPCPAASKMNALIWDSSLEAIATYWAHQCIWSHHVDVMGYSEQMDRYQTLCDEDGCMATGYSNDTWIGENLACTATDGSPSWSITNALEGIDRWYNESQLYYWDDQSSGGTTGHYTMGVYDESRYIGCGYANCDVNSPFGSTYSNWFYFACKYYPGGGWSGEDPYVTGTKCSDCEPDRSTCSGADSALCDGGMCLNCAVDYFWDDDCGYDDTTCPSTMYYGDGIGNQTTSTPTTADTDASTAVPTPSPTQIVTTTTTDAPTKDPTAVPTESPTQSTVSTTTDAPTAEPTDSPSDLPTESPTTTTMIPTEAPSTTIMTEAPSTSTPTTAPSMTTKAPSTTTEAPSTTTAAPSMSTVAPSTTTTTVTVTATEMDSESDSDSDSTSPSPEIATTESPETSDSTVL